MDSDSDWRDAQMALKGAQAIPDEDSDDAMADADLKEAQQMAQIQAYNMQKGAQRRAAGLDMHVAEDPVPMSSKAAGVLRMPDRPAVDIKQVMGKMVMSDLFDEDEMTQVKA